MTDHSEDFSSHGRSLSVDSPPTGLGNADRHEISDARKLGKALRLIEKLKEKCAYEKDVNQELAQRNEVLKREVKEENEKMKVVVSAFDDLHRLCAALLDENEKLLTQGPPTVEKEISDAKQSLLERRNTIDNLKHTAHNPKAKRRLKRLVSEVGINIVPEVGTSLLRRSSVDPSMDLAAMQRASGSRPSLAQRRSLSSESLDNSFSNVNADDARMEGLGHTHTPSSPGEKERDLTTLMRESEQMLARDSFDRKDGLSFDGSVASAPTTPLFEHFLLVGVTSENADSIINKLKKQLSSQDKLSSRLLRKFGFSKKSATPNTMTLMASPMPVDKKSSSDGLDTSTKGQSTAVDKNGKTVSPSATTAAKPTKSSWFFRSTPVPSVDELERPTMDVSTAGKESIAESTATASTATADTPVSDDSNTVRIRRTSSGSSIAVGDDVASNGTMEVDSRNQIFGGRSVFDPNKISLFEHSETMNPGIIYRYPQEVEPPPIEVADFCMPVGGKLFRINPTDEETTSLRLLYSHEGSRSSRCFVFVLEDRTIEADAQEDDDLCVSSGRLYGVCVLHPRLLASSTPSTAPAGPTFDFLAPVCYCFITRFPIFDFFFKVIFGMIQNERILRMEGVQQNPLDTAYERRSYRYVPDTVITSILDELSKTKPPKLGEDLRFTMPTSMSLIEYVRVSPREELTEHYANSLRWALPVLLDWLPPQIITLAISLLMCEAKLIVIGDEPGMVSCVVMSLMALLKPLNWVTPLIPVLPLKHIDFIEAPLPIVAGVVLYGEAFAMDNANYLRLTQTPTGGVTSVHLQAPGADGSADSSMNHLSSPDLATSYILSRCEDDSNITAVLDLCKPDIFVRSTQVEMAKKHRFPGLEEFLDSVDDIFTKYRAANYPNYSPPTSPNYAVNARMVDEADMFQDMLRKYLVKFADESCKKFETFDFEAATLAAQEPQKVQATSSTCDDSEAAKTTLESPLPQESTVPTADATNTGDADAATPAPAAESEGSTVVASGSEGATVDRSASVDSAKNQIVDLRAMAPPVLPNAGEVTPPPRDVPTSLTLSFIPGDEDDQVFYLKFYGTQMFCQYKEEMDAGMECVAPASTETPTSAPAPLAGTPASSAAHGANPERLSDLDKISLHIETVSLGSDKADATGSTASDGTTEPGDSVTSEGHASFVSAFPVSAKRTPSAAGQMKFFPVLDRSGKLGIVDNEGVATTPAAISGNSQLQSVPETEDDVKVEADAVDSKAKSSPTSEAAAVTDAAPEAVEVSSELLSEI